jgi:hypothetical protein
VSSEVFESTVYPDSASWQNVSASTTLAVEDGMPTKGD